VANLGPAALQSPFDDCNWTFELMRCLRPTLVFTILFVLGCASTSEDELENLSANELYDRAKTALNTGDYETAINTFEKLEARYPFGKYAQQAQLEIAYAYYKFDEPDSAIAAADRFIRNNPGSPHLDYAYYLKGLTNYNRGASIIDRMAPREPSERDTRALREAFNDFTQLLKKFPDSRYAGDATQRLVYLHNQLAQYEIHVANYYMKRGAYVAAVNRAKYVLENYQRTPAAREALQVLIRAYSKMGLDGLARDAQRVLELNEPDVNLPAAAPDSEAPKP
jgi:outer membrane protein assembly factor BamD